MIVFKLMKRILPKKVRDIIRPWYHWCRKRYYRITNDTPSYLSMGLFSQFEIAYRKDTADETIIHNDSFDNDIFFSRVPEYNPDDNHVIIDIGAHIGTFALLSSSKVNKGKVYAIEANKDSYNFLRINVALNQCKNISIHHLAISDKNGISILHHDSENWGHSTTKKIFPSNETVVCECGRSFGKVRKFLPSNETVESSTLTNFLKTNQIEKCHFMKLNCEGAEFPILLSTPKNILERFSIILVLYHCDLWNNNTEDDLISHLESSGFSCVIRHKSDKRGWIIATSHKADNKN